MTNEGNEKGPSHPVTGTTGAKLRGDPMWSPDNHSCTNNLALEEVTVSDTLVRAVTTGADDVPSPFDTTAGS